MSAQISKKIPETAQIPVSDYVIFGGTGDLSLRKILPALLWRFYDGQVTPDFRLFIVSRKPPAKAEFEQTLKPYCQSALDQFQDAEAVWQDFLSILTIQPVDLMGGDGMADLAGLILNKASAGRPLIFYMASYSEDAVIYCAKTGWFCHRRVLLSKNRSGQIRPPQRLLIMCC